MSGSEYLLRSYGQFEKMTFFFTGPPINGRGATSASGVTTMVGDDDIINRGEQCGNGYLLALSSTTDFISSEDSKIWEVPRKLPGSRQEVARTTPAQHYVTYSPS